MKKYIYILALLVGSVLNMNGQNWPPSSGNSSGDYSSISATATLKIINRSSYSLVVKVMKTGGRGLYKMVIIAPNSSRMVSFSRSDSFFTKTKASNSIETLYKKSGTFSVKCDKTGYSQSTLEFFVTSGGGGTGQGISKAEFEKDR